jgi:ribosomal protein S1
MKIKTAFSLLAVASLGLSSVALGGVKDYQVTGPILEINDSMIVVEKSKGKNERWEIARDSNTKAPADLKVGDKVTIHYTMTATNVEAKADKAEKSKAAASPAKPN